MATKPINKDEMKQFKICYICNEKFGFKSFGSHIKETHGFKDNHEYMVSKIDFDKREWPLCYCGQKVYYDSHHDIFGKYCSKNCRSQKIKHTDETKQKISKTMKENWSDETKREMMSPDRGYTQTTEYRENMSNVIKKVYEERPELYEKLSCIMVDRWANPEFKERVLPKVIAGLHSKESEEKKSFIMTEMYSKPEYKKLFSDSANRLWKDIDYRIKTVNALKIATQKPEYKKLKREQALSEWSDPDTREKILTAMSESITPELTAERRERFQSFHTDPILSQKRKDNHLKSVQTDEYRNNMKRILKERWSDPKFREKMSKVGYGRRSEEEKVLFKFIQNIYPSAEHSHHITSTDTNGITIYKIPDIYIPELNTIIEYDGEYFHPFNKTYGLDCTQLINLSNDISKNEIYKNNKIRFYRISSKGNDELFNKLTTNNFFDCLLKYSYMAYDEKGICLKDETTKNKLTYNDIIIPRERILPVVFNNDKEYLDELSENIYYYIKHYSPKLPQIDPNETIKDIFQYNADFIDFNKENEIYIASNIGITYLKSLFYSFWNSKKNGTKSLSPNDVWGNYKKLRRVIDYRVGNNDSKLYEYDFIGEKIQCHETFDISLRTIMKGLSAGGYSVSFFKPVMAYEVYKNIINIDSPSVYDPSCGFGGRMLGFSMAFNSGEYYGCEPNVETYNELIKLSEIIRTVKPNLNFKIYNECSENLVIDKKFDLAFTCPPYFTKEIYCDDNNQCYNKYINEKEWFEKYMLKTINNCKQMTNKICLVIDKELLENINNSGIIINKQLTIRNNKSHLSGKSSKNNEYLIVI